MKRWLVFIAGCLVSAACLLWLLHTTDLDAAQHTIASAHPALWGLAALVYLLGFLPRALRWRFMLAPTGHYKFGDLLRCIMLGYTGNNILPFRLGEVIRATAFHKLTGGSGATGLASVVAERMLDGITLVLVLLSVLLSSAASHTAPGVLRPIYICAALMAAVGLLGLIGAWWASATLVRYATRISPRLGRFAEHGIASLAFLENRRLLVLVVFLSLLVWGVEGSVFVILAAGIGLPSPFMIGFLSLAVVNLGILIPAAPGYLGVFQAASVLAFAAMARPEPEGLAFGVLVHSAQFLPLTMLGLILAIPLWDTLSRAAHRAPSSSRHG